MDVVSTMRIHRIAVRALTCFVALAILTGCQREPVRFAFIDRTGNVHIALKSGQNAGNFSEGLAAVSLNGKWGYIDATGRFAIDRQFGSAGEFSEGLALVTTAPADDYWKKSTLFGYIDKTGKFAIPPRFNWALSFSEGLAPVCIGPCRNDDLAFARVGHVDRRGEFALPPVMSSASQFSEGRAWASSTRFSGRRLMDRSGRFVSLDRFVWAHKFSHGLAATDKGFVDRDGKVVFSLKATDESDFSDGWAVAFDGETTVFIDTAGKVVLRPRYQSVGPYSEGLAPACKSDCGPSTSGQNWGYMDKTGKFVIPPQFGNKPGPFRSGLALVCFGCEG